MLISEDIIDDLKDYMYNKEKTYKFEASNEKLVEDIDENYLIEIPEITLEGAKEHLTLILVNTENNKSLFEIAPHRELLDGELSAIPYWNITEEESFLFKNEMLDKLNITEDELFKICYENVDKLDFHFQLVSEYIQDMIGRHCLNLREEYAFKTSLPIMYFATIQNFRYGAKILLSETALGNIHEKLGDFIIIPSSIHEVIFIPYSDDLNREYFYNLVYETNRTILSLHEFLSDTIMLYDGKELSKF